MVHDLRRGAGRLNNTWEVDSSLGVAWNRKSLRRRAALLRPVPHAILVFRSRSATASHMLRYQGLRVCGGLVAFWHSTTVNPEAYHFWGIIDSPCTGANKLRGSIGNLTCMSIGVAYHTRARAGFPQKFGRWVNIMGKGELHATDRTIRPSIRWARGGQARGDRRDLHSENSSGSRGRLLLRHIIAGSCLRCLQGPR